MTIRKYTSHRITGTGRSRWTARPTNPSTSNAKGSNIFPGNRTRTCECAFHVPRSSSLPHTRLVRFKSVCAPSSVHSRPGYLDDTPDRRCASLEASRSVHEVSSFPKRRGEEDLNSGQDSVSLVSALLMTLRIPNLFFLQPMVSSFVAPVCPPFAYHWFTTS